MNRETLKNISAIFIALFILAFVGNTAIKQGNTSIINKKAETILKLTYEHSNLKQLETNNIKLAEYMTPELYAEEFDVNREVVLVTRYFPFEGSTVQLEIQDSATEYLPQKGIYKTIAVFRLSGGTILPEYRTSIMEFNSKKILTNYEEYLGKIGL